MRQRLAVGNWKMNGLQSDLREIAALSDVAKSADCKVVICPPATLIHAASHISDAIAIGGQTCHEMPSGAHTGDISAQMLADCGAQYVILGHSERRQDHCETDQIVHDQTQMAWDAGLIAIICIGENLEDNKAGQTLQIIGQQLAASVPNQATAENLVIAYEPIWAIGTGLIPTLEEIHNIHSFIRAELIKRFEKITGQSIRILYGGSMNAKNVSDILAVSNVDGGLVGGASLKAVDFSKIIAAVG